MRILRFIIIAVLFGACSSWDKVDIPADQCNSSETLEKFKEKTRKALSELSDISSNFYDFSKMDEVRCTGYDYPAGDGPSCAKKCRPYQIGGLTEKSDAVEIALSHINEEIMVVEVAWVPGAMKLPTEGPPKKLESGGVLPGKEPAK